MGLLINTCISDDGISDPEMTIISASSHSNADTWNHGIPEMLFFVLFAATAALISKLLSLFVRWCMVKFQLGGLKKSKHKIPLESPHLNLPIQKRLSQPHSEIFHICSGITLGETLKSSLSSSSGKSAEGKKSSGNNSSTIHKESQTSSTTNGIADKNKIWWENNQHHASLVTIYESDYWAQVDTTDKRSKASAGKNIFGGATEKQD